MFEIFFFLNKFQLHAVDMYVSVVSWQVLELVAICQVSIIKPACILNLVGQSCHFSWPFWKMKVGFWSSSLIPWDIFINCCDWVWPQRLPLSDGLLTLYITWEWCFYLLLLQVVYKQKPCGSDSLLHVHWHT